MTEAEFKAAVKPIVAQYPTPELKIKLMVLWMEAASSGIPGHRLGELAREALYSTLPGEDDDSDDFTDWPKNRTVN